jgi:predicted permease
MLATLSVIFPVFGLVVLGFACRRIDLLGPLAASELNRFVVWLALPAVLFEITAHDSWTQIWQPRFLATFGLASAIVFASTLAWRRRAGRPLADASIDAIAASYANTGYIGIPLCLMAFGRSSLALVGIATIWVVCVMFAIAVVLIEVDVERDGGSGGIVLRVVGRVLRNPLIAAPLLGALVSASDVGIATPVDALLRLLGDAASPCALVSIGLFIAEKRDRAQTTSGAGVTVALTLAKLLVMPAIAWLLATQVFALPPPMVPVTVLLAALPTGSGPFMLAEFYRREAQASSQTILWSTVCSIVTLALVLTGFRS